MKQTGTPKKDRKQSILNMTLAIVTGQVGCVTLLIVLGAVFLGLWLDNRFSSRPTFTIITLIVSIPVSLLMMFFIVRITLSKIKSGQDEQKPDLEEGSDLGKDS